MQHTSGFSLVPAYLEGVNRDGVEVIVSLNSVRYANADSILRGLVYSNYAKAVVKLRGMMKFMRKYDDTEQLRNVFNMINYFPCENDNMFVDKGQWGNNIIPYNWSCFLEAALYRGSHLMAQMIFKLDAEYYTNVISTERRINLVRASISSGQLKAVQKVFTTKQ